MPFKPSDNPKPKRARPIFGFPPAAMNDEQAAHYIGFCREWLRNSRKPSRGPATLPGPPFVKVGRAVRYLRADLDAWLAAHRQEPPR